MFFVKNAALLSSPERIKPAIRAFEFFDVTF